jgi:hypothetical protein
VSRSKSRTTALSRQSSAARLFNLQNKRRRDLETRNIHRCPFIL